MSVAKKCFETSILRNSLIFQRLQKILKISKISKDFKWFLNNTEISTEYQFQRVLLSQNMRQNGGR